MLKIARKPQTEAVALLNLGHVPKRGEKSGLDISQAIKRTYCLDNTGKKKKVNKEKGMRKHRIRCVEGEIANAVRSYFQTSLFTILKLISF